MYRDFGTIFVFIFIGIVLIYLPLLIQKLLAPNKSKLEELKAKGYKVTVYVPFGKSWFDYSIRRLKENPKIVSYVIKNLFKK